MSAGPENFAVMRRRIGRQQGSHQVGHNHHGGDIPACASAGSAVPCQGSRMNFSMLLAATLNLLVSQAEVD